MLKAAVLALPAVCAIPALVWAGSTLCLTAKENGQTVAMRKGTEFSLALRQNITTGYSWQVVSHGEPAVEQLGDPVFVPDSSLHGAGGTVTFRFRAAAEGKGELKLVYARPWEKGAEPAGSFAATIVVEK